ncbi:MAG TPA: ABC transporter permease, partial [Thermoanaerobaculia bacterium]|nr:ABC transporter permease [Thermoanaerobaculia bacterium]
MEQLWRDVAHALRTLARRPLLAAVALVTLAVGIGANTALFSAADATLLARLPGAEPDRTVLLWLDNTRLGIRNDIAPYPLYRAWVDGAPAVEAAAVYRPGRANLTGGDGAAERVDWTRVEDGFLEVIGVEPLLGRAFDAADFAGEGDAVLLSHGLWQRRFAGDRDVVGRTLELDARPYRVVGVLPAAAGFPRDSELWAPLVMSAEQREAQGRFWLYTVARLTPGTPLATAQEQLDAVAARYVTANPDFAGYGVYAEPLRQHLVGDVARPLAVLLVAVACVLLIGCGNVANLLLARAAGRRREVAVRVALGAGRRRLVAQVLTEGVVLAAFGGVLGIAVAVWATRGLTALAPAGLLPEDGLAVDARVLAFAVVLSLATGLLVGLLPALHLSRQAAGAVLARGGRGASEDRRGKRLRSALIAAEVGLALVLLVGSGLLLRSFGRLAGLDTGFEAEQVLLADLALAPARYPEPAQAVDFYARLSERLAGLPGVEAAGAASDVLLPELAMSTTFGIEGRPDPPPEQRLEVPVVAVAGDYFEAVGLPLVAGRAFGAGDSAEATPVVIINRSMARRFWPGQDPLGQRIKYGGRDSDGPWRTVVGVVADARRTRQESEDRPSTYLPHAQVPMTGMTLALRSGGAPRRLAGVVRDTVAALDPAVPVTELSLLDERLGQRLAGRRFNALLLAAFAAVALFLAVVGVYGVVAFSVARGTREIGVRMALGAGRARVVAGVLRDGLTPVLAGLAAGLGAAALAGRALGSLLYDVSATDPTTFAAVPILLLAVAA